MIRNAFSIYECTRHSGRRCKSGRGSLGVGEFLMRLKTLNYISEGVGSVETVSNVA